MTQALRYVDITGVAWNSQTRRPVAGSTAASPAGGMLASTVAPGGAASASRKLAFIQGSSKQGNASRAYVGCGRCSQMFMLVQLPSTPV